MQDHVINEKAVAYIKIWGTSTNKKRHISFSTKPMTNMKFDRMLDFYKELLTIKLLDSSLASWCHMRNCNAYLHIYLVYGAIKLNLWLWTYGSTKGANNHKFIILSKRFYVMLCRKWKMLHLLFGSRWPPNSKKTFTEESLFANSHGSLIIKGHLQIWKATWPLDHKNIWGNDTSKK